MDLPRDLFLFKDGHVLHVRSETIVDRRRMNIVLGAYGDQMITGDECGPNFLEFCLTVEGNPRKNSTRKLTRPGIEPGPAA